MQFTHENITFAILECTFVFQLVYTLLQI